MLYWCYQRFPNQYTRYYYLMTDGNNAHNGFIDQLVYDRLKEKEAVMMNAIEGNLLLPEVGDDYLEDVKKVIKKIRIQNINYKMIEQWTR